MKNLKILKGILTISISVATGFKPAPTFSGEAETYFADKLFNEGMYKKALIEYERLNFFSPDFHFQEKIGKCYRKLGELENAASAFEKAGATEELIQVYLELGEYSLARFVCEDLDVGASFNPALLIGWIYTLEGRWDEAAQTFEQIGRNDLRTAALVGKKLPYKSENLASVLSMVVPGAGEIYAEKWVDGALTLALNCLSAGFAIKSLREHDYVSGALITTFFWNRFYHGGIINARTMVREYNKRIKEDYLKEVREKYNYENL